MVGTINTSVNCQASRSWIRRIPRLSKARDWTSQISLRRFNYIIYLWLILDHIIHCTVQLEFLASICVCFVFPFFLARDFCIWSEPMYVWLWLASLHDGEGCILSSNLSSLPSEYFKSNGRREAGDFLWQRSEILWN